MAENTEHKPWSEPMVWGESAEPVPVSEYKGDLVDAATVGVIDEPSPAATHPRAVVIDDEGDQIAPKAKKK